MAEAHSRLRPSPPQGHVQTLHERLNATREASLSLASKLTAEDMVVQASDEASPTKWHLAHVTWFFEEFVLRKFLTCYKVFDDRFAYCFNSYYEALGPRHPRRQRGHLTRPSHDEVLRYRAHVDRYLNELLASACTNDALDLIELGINHEQQHQELILTDILALFAENPLRPAYDPDHATASPPAIAPLRWQTIESGIVTIGHDGAGFAWDNEGPRHDVLLQPFKIADRLVSNGDWRDFIVDAGYATPSLWLSDGWTTINKNDWSAPRYWERIDDVWHEMTLAGLRPLDTGAPVRHVSYFEADAYARWAGYRLPTEFEWEAASKHAMHTSLADMFGKVWQWTASAYLPYPGYRPPPGAVGEYNGKFMVGQHVLRGSSFATPEGHARTTYRNFFYPHQRWQFTGLRLAAETR